MDTTTVMVAVRSANVDVDGTPVRVRRRQTTAHAGAAIVQTYQDLWTPLVVDFPADDTDAGEPAAKDVRAWARSEGIEVPARGKLPDDVVAAYKAAHED